MTLLQVILIKLFCHEREIYCVKYFTKIKCLEILKMWAIYLVKCILIINLKHFVCIFTLDTDLIMWSYRFLHVFFRLRICYSTHCQLSRDLWAEGSNHSETRILVSDWLQLTGLNWKLRLNWQKLNRTNIG